VSAIPGGARRVLRDGVLCHLAAPGPGGPHVTPVVFVLEGDRIWATVARGTAKARRWRRQPVASGLVQVGDAGLAFRGTVTIHDVLDPDTWPVSIARAPRVTLASIRFSLKNARFFAGYARDAARVPLGWTPPGRVFVSVDLDAGALLDRTTGRVTERWGDWGARVASARDFRPTRGAGPDRLLPEEIRPLLEGPGDGVLGIEGSRGPVVLPVGWARAGGAYYASLPRAFLRLAGAPSESPAGLVIDMASRWRAARMRGVLLRGDAVTYSPDRVRTGREALLARAPRTGDHPAEVAVLRIRPSTAVWWMGWASATVGRS
jgi:nitroimidazol reductase NimA-like FMN-containing flavoprotein (pyridoxamine 5'-phosphate oxidase superfamily)